VWSFLPGVQFASFSAHPGQDYLVAISVEVNIGCKLASIFGTYWRDLTV